MGKRLALFRALALKNLSLQLKRKGSTCCQFIVPILITLTVGIITAATSTSMESPKGVKFDNTTFWNNLGLYSTFANISFTQSNLSTLPIGTLSYLDGNNSGIMGFCPQINYLYNSSFSYKSPFLGEEFKFPSEIDTYFAERLYEIQICINGQSPCDTTTNTSAAIYFQYFTDEPQIEMNFTVQAGFSTDLYNLGFGSGGNSYSLTVDTTDIFSYFTSIVHNSMYRYLSNDTTSLLVTGFVEMPYRVVGDLEGNIFGLVLLPFASSFLFSVYMYTLVLEKKDGLVQKMHSSGLPMVTYWIVNYIYNLLLYLFITTALFIFGIFFGVSVFLRRPAEVIILLFLWGNAQVAMCQFLTCFLWKPTLASIVGYMLAIFGSVVGCAMELLYFLQTPQKLPSGWYLLYPGFAFYHGFGLLVYSSVNVNYGIPILINSHFLLILLILICETIVLFVLTWYLEAIFPREIGIHRNPLFPILALIKTIKKPTFDEEKVNLLVLPKASNNINEDEDVVRERELTQNSNALVKIIELSKKYPGSSTKEPKIALDCVSFRVQANECFGLLGPNGAGKTTLLSILSGILAPTSGLAFIDGLNLHENLEEVNAIVACCPQFDVLWSELTVTDHLLFYMRLKESTKLHELARVHHVLEEVGLEEVANRTAGELSGGQKRRLSIAIAMMGKPKLILMDEPTTGLDPSSRRALWDIIIKAKERHSIVLSTHSMEEAEILCNRIGIMRKARLHSIGTQMHLKNKFELGYNIKISHFANSEVEANNFLMETVPSAVLVPNNCVGGTLVYKITKGDFILSDLFKKMELNRHYHGIKEWSIKQASLEDVFLAIVTEDEYDQ